MIFNGLFSTVQHAGQLIELGPHFADLADEKLLESVNAVGFIEFEVGEQLIEQAEGVFGRNGQVIQTLDDGPDLPVHSVYLFGSEELASDEIFDDFADAEDDFVDLVVGQHHDEGFFQLEADHLAVALVVSEQHGEEVEEGVLHLPSHLAAVLPGEGSFPLEHSFDHLDEGLLLRVFELSEADGEDLGRDHPDEDDTFIGLVVCEPVQAEQSDVLVDDVPDQLFPLGDVLDVGLQGIFGDARNRQESVFPGFLGV